MVMTVTEAKQGAEAIVPFTLKDTGGNRWSFTVHVSVQIEETVKNALFENYPNPFNPSTTITYTLAESGHTRLDVFNSLGQRILTLFDGAQSAGVHAVNWDGRDENGLAVSGGIYFYRLQSGSYSKTMKMVLFK